MVRSIILFIVCLWLSKAAIAQTPTPDFSADAVAGCSPLVVSFTDRSSGSPTSWLWDFGNGATSSLKNPSTTYFSAGSYTVTLTVTNADGSKSVTRSNYITVYGNPSVSFNADDSSGCYPFPVQFRDNSVASPGTINTGWVWDLGDGTQATSQNPKNIYQHEGNYTVSLKVTNDKGCWSVATKHSYIKTDGGVKANFSFVQPISCRSPFTIHYLNESTGPGLLSYAWDFGDGNTSTEPTPVHTYNSTGVYSVMLVTKSSAGCIDTIRKNNLLNLQNMSTAFTVPDSICVGNEVRFVNTSSAAANASSNWNFGDGSTSATTNPVKMYGTTGTFTVKLLQTYGICTDSATKNIQVFPRPTAVFKADKTAHCQAPLAVTFQNTSADAVAYQWNFGDSTFSNEANPSHTYTTYGSFDVTLIATNASGCSDTLRMQDYINITKPSITFPSLPVKGCIPYTVSLQAVVETPDPVASYLWDFGNGATSTDVTPSYTYTEQGTYNVKLTVTTINGCTDTLTMQEAVKVGRKPVVNFSAVPNQVCAYQSVQFTNTTTEGTSWSWSFGDGSIASDKNPSFQYSDTGTFSVKLVADNNGCKDSMEISRYITVKPPIASFSYQTSCDNKLVYAFTDRSVGAKTWQWNFGDGTTSTQQSPTHTFRGLGTYTVQLTVSNDSCFHLYRAVIRIGNGTPNFTTLSPTVCKGTSVSFRADSTNASNIVSYTWNFGNGTFGEGKTTSTTFSEAGIYNVSLIVKDINGCIDSTVKEQVIQINGPTAGIKASNNTGCKGLQATFIDASKDDGRSKIVQWQWNLGDGTIVNQTSPVRIQHIYTNSGTFDVSLKVTDAGGCSDNLLLPALVHASAIKADFVSADTVSCPGAAISFTNTSSAITAFSSVWSFDNGSFSDQQNSTTTYNADGLYTVKLKIEDAYGCSDSLVKKDYISIKHPVASFTVNDSVSSCIPFRVQYTNTSSHYTQHVWNLGGGTNRLNNPTQYYNQPGVYETKLIVTSPGGCTDTATKTISVYDIGATKLQYLPLSGCKPLTVDLTTLSQLKMDYIWDFGDGTIISSKDTVKQHVYNTFGDFVPKIIMKNSGGCITSIHGVDTIRIKGATAKFGLDKRLFCDSGLVRFSDSTTFNNPVTSYAWNFGDGSTSSQNSPTHHYTQPGLYNVSLSVQTENKCVDTFQLQYPVKVAASPAVRILGDSVICSGEGIEHLGSFEKRDTSLIQWLWNFPNGKTAAVQKPQRQYYKEAGRFVVQTIAANSSGCKDTAYQNIHVHPIPSVTLPATITTTVGTPVLLPAVYSGAMKTYHWTVPDGLSCTDCPQPMAAPKFDTKYNVQFVDSNGCRNWGAVQLIVLCNNDNVFVPNTFSPNGDGSNDIFYIRGKGLSRVKVLRIFNRWGQAVFEKANFNVNDVSMGWDGTFKGAKPVPDVYVYQVEIFCDNSQVVKFDGNVALIQ